VHAFLTVRRLKPGSYDDWRKAWEPDEWPDGSKRAYILRNVDDPDEVIAFGFYDRDLAQARQEPRLQGAAARPLRADGPVRRVDGRRRGV